MSMRIPEPKEEIASNNLSNGVDLILSHRNYALYFKDDRDDGDLGYSVTRKTCIEDIFRMFKDQLAKEYDLMDVNEALYFTFEEAKNMLNIDTNLQSVHIWWCQ